MSILAQFKIATNLCETFETAAGGDMVHHYDMSQCQISDSLDHTTTCKYGSGVWPARDASEQTVTLRTSELQPSIHATVAQFLGTVYEIQKSNSFVGTLYTLLRDVTMTLGRAASQLVVACGQFKYLVEIGVTLGYVTLC